jgi:hypothetical protein
VYVGHVTIYSVQSHGHVAQQAMLQLLRDQIDFGDVELYSIYQLGNLLLNLELPPDILSKARRIP